MDFYSELCGLNSSVCEQYHSYLSRVRETVKHMRQDHFMILLRTFINIWNANKIASR